MTHEKAITTIANLITHDVLRLYKEFELPDRRRADLLFITKSAHVGIIEVKTTWRASLIPNAMAKYAQWCHFLTIATTEPVDMNDPTLETKILTIHKTPSSVGIAQITDRQLLWLRQPLARFMRAENLRTLSDAIPHTPLKVVATEKEKKRPHAATA